MANNFLRSMQSRGVLTCAFGLLLAAAGLLVYALPGGFALEESVALDFLFNQRSKNPPPDHVILVAINKTVVQQLGQTGNPETWPRDLHARLIDQLAKAGAAVIVFDVFFHKEKNREHDARLTQAMREAGNVVVFSKLQREVKKLAEGIQYNLEHLILPMPMLQQAAVASAPFVLPKLPVKVNQFWTFHSAVGDHPSLPTVALEFYVAKHHTLLFEVFSRIFPQQATVFQASLEGLDQRERIVQIRTFFRQQTAITQRLLDALQEMTESESRQRIQALLAVYLGSERRYLNFYGPSRSITTHSYYDLLSAAPAELALFKNKVVFVGLVAEHQPEQEDNFYTVFSQANGLDLSGVEIAATAFANLSTPHSAQKNLRLPEPMTYIAIIFGFGLLLAGLNYIPSTSAFVILSVFVAGLYTLVCLQVFATTAYWLPLFVPVLLQTPLALFLGLLWRQQQLGHERRRIRQAFGLYLPEKVIEDLARNSQQRNIQSKRMFGVCLASDAEQYTRLAERLTPEALSHYMHNYYERLFKPIRERDGIISDVVGDAMLAIWSAQQPESRLRRQACEAALETLNTEQAQGSDTDLRTRIGLHAGDIVLGNIGALDHYEYRAVGDIVNTASRIEGLNKQLGTYLLVSETVLSGLDGFVSRELGTFCMVGKQKAIVIHELLGLQDENESSDDVLCQCFSKCLFAYQQHHWQAAKVHFLQILNAFSDDGPSRYYLDRCELHMQNRLPLPQNGVIVLQKK